MDVVWAAGRSAPHRSLGSCCGEGLEAALGMLLQQRGDLGSARASARLGKAIPILLLLLLGSDNPSRV